MICDKTSLKFDLDSTIRNVNVDFPSSNKWSRSRVKQKPVNGLTAMDVMFLKALNSFDSETVRDAFHTRSATKLIIAQAKEEQTLGRP